MNQKYVPFPKNRHQLTNGSLIKATDEKITRDLGIKVGSSIPIAWDGEYVRCSQFTWDVEQICQEIDRGWWSFTGESVDFSCERQRQAYLEICRPKAIDTLN
jgi:hypothetical protein